MKDKVRSSARIASVDFWRGVVLVMIFIDHVPHTPFAYLTYRNFGFPDAAEAFVFLSGLVLAYVSWPRLEKGDLVTTVRRSLHRAWQLYGTHLALTFAAIVVFGIGHALGGPDYFIAGDNRAPAFDQPAEAMLGTIVLGYQIGYFNILPVYVVLMLLAPFLLWCVHRHLLLGLFASLSIYVAARFGLHLPSWPYPYNWFLNPFAWQLIFTIGMVVGGSLRGRGIPFSRAAFALAIAIVAFSFAFVRGWVPEPELFRPYLDTDKGILGLTRLASFLALAYLLAQLRVGDLLLRVPGMREVERLGRQSLSIFAAGSILSALGAIAIGFTHEKSALAFQMTAVLSIPIGIAVLVGVARFLEWQQKNSAGLSVPVRALFGADRVRSHPSS